VQHLLDIENLHDGAVDLGHAGDEGAIAGTGRRRPHVASGALHNALDPLHMQALTRAAHLGDDQTTVVLVSRTALTDGARQIDHRHRRATQGGDTAHIRVTTG